MSRRGLPRESLETCAGTDDAGLVAEGAARPALSRRPLGRSTLGRPLDALVVGPPRAALRMLVIAGQHGDEPRGRAAARRWMAGAAADARSGGPIGGVGRAAILDANPDGSSSGSRRNAQGLDLNRDHLVLAAPETRAMHAFVRRYRPHLIVDVHDYPARRRYLVANGWTIDPDVQLAGPTNPAIRTALDPADLEDLLNRLRLDLGSCGYSVAPYTLFRRSGKARPSTLNTLDARNTLSLRYGIPTLLLEGRDAGQRGTEEEARRTVAAQVEALRSIDAWAQAHAKQLLRGPPICEAGEANPLDARWGPTPTPHPVALRRAASGQREVVPWTRYAGTLQVRSVLRLPRAYAVRDDAVALRDILARQGFRSRALRSPGPALEKATGQDNPEPNPCVSDAGRAGSRDATDLEGYVLYPVQQHGGRALALWLEARSRFGLVRSGILPAASLSGATPAVLRVHAWVDPPRSRLRPKAQRTEEGFPTGGEGRLASSGRRMVPDPVSNDMELRRLASASLEDVWS